MDITAEHTDTRNADTEAPPAAPRLAAPRPEAPGDLALSEASIQRVAEHLKVLADPTRLRLLFELAEGEICVGDLAGQVGGSQANVSKHLAVLRKAGLVTCRRDGMNVCYSIVDPSVFTVCRTVRDALSARADRQAEELRADCGGEDATQRET